MAPGIPPDDDVGGGVADCPGIAVSAPTVSLGLGVGVGVGVAASPTRTPTTVTVPLSVKLADGIDDGGVGVG